MQVDFVKIFIELILFYINILLIAKGQKVNRLDENERKNRFLKFVIPDVRKDTKLHFSVLFIAIIVIVLEIVYAFWGYGKSCNSFGQAFINVSNQISQNFGTVIICAIVFVVCTVLFMIITYRSVGVISQTDGDGNRRLTVSEIDNEYIEFSKPESIDGHSNLLLIAGDLSFLGDIPDIESIKNRKTRETCKKMFSESCSDYECCTKKCPPNLKNKCIRKSKQFEQLVELRKNGITFHIICKEPNLSNDIQYKRRLGFLKTILEDNLSIHFLPKDTLESGICVLGRIKVNGGIKQLFWHWKDPEQHRIYIVPEPKKVDSSENKTLIYLLETVLWQFAKEADQSLFNGYIKEYEKVIN